MRRTRLAGIILTTIVPLAALAATPAASAAHSSPRPMPSSPITSRPALARGPAIAGDALVFGSNVSDEYSSAGKPISVVYLGTGEYDLVFAGLGGIGAGNVEVTPWEIDASCEPNAWGPEQGAPANFVVLVNCFLNGQLSDANFLVTVTRARSAPGGVFDYALSYRSSGSGKLTGATQYNSEGGVNSVRFLGTGRYQILFGGKPARGTTGVVKVTGEGFVAGYCNPVSFGGTRHGEVVDVDCFNQSGKSQDQEFLITYATGANVMAETGLITANALVNSQAPVYQPKDQFVSRRGGRVTVVHFALGQYEIVFSNLAPPANNIGNMQVSAIAKAAVCEVSSVYTPGTARYASTAYISCYNLHHAPADAAFTMSYALH